MNELVLYTAEGCGPCRSVKPTIQQWINEGRPVRMVDVDKQQAEARAAGVMAVPTFILYIDGVPVEKVVGAKTPAVLDALVRRAEA